VVMMMVMMMIMLAMMTMAMMIMAMMLMVEPTPQGVVDRAADPLLTRACYMVNNLLRCVPLSTTRTTFKTASIAPIETQVSTP